MSLTHRRPAVTASYPWATDHDVFTDDFELGVALRNDLFNRRQLCGGENIQRVLDETHWKVATQEPRVTLSMGTRMPALALRILDSSSSGSSGSSGGGGGDGDSDGDGGAQAAAEATAKAVSVSGYKHVFVEARDTGACRGVGAALRALAPSLDRRAVFITVRAPPPESVSESSAGAAAAAAAGTKCGDELVGWAAAARTSLGVTRVDLLLVSAPRGGPRPGGGTSLLSGSGGHRQVWDGARLR